MSPKTDRGPSLAGYLARVMQSNSPGMVDVRSAESRCCLFCSAEDIGVAVGTI
jgi:hypothetical protein